PRSPTLTLIKLMLFLHMHASSTVLYPLSLHDALPISWILPNLGSSFVSVFTGGSGFIRPGTSSNADNVPAADRFRGSKVTYVEVNAQHNGILHNEHVLRRIRKRLGTYTVAPYIDRTIE